MLIHVTRYIFIVNYINALFFFFFFFNDTATTEIYTLSLHDALPILFKSVFQYGTAPIGGRKEQHPPRAAVYRSEEHTSELQSQSNLVCRLLLEKKKINSSNVVFTAHLTHVYTRVRETTISSHTIHIR